MTFTEFLNFQLITTEKFTLSIYSIVLSVFLVIGTFVFLRLAKGLFMRMVKSRRTDLGSANSIYLIFKYFVWVIVFVIILETGGVKVSILLASLAALLVGVGLGIQQLFNDFASGIVLLIERNLKMHDVIELDNGEIGQVISIGIRTSMIKTRDDIVLIIPNSKFVNDKIINWSHMEKNTRFNIKIGVAYNSDVRLVERCLLECADKLTQIVQAPEPFVRFSDFGESALEFQLFFWIEDSFMAEHIKSELRFMINELLKANHIEIPFPQRDVHIKRELGTENTF